MVTDGFVSRLKHNVLQHRQHKRRKADKRERDKGRRKVGRKKRQERERERKKKIESTKVIGQIESTASKHGPGNFGPWWVGSYRRGLLADRSFCMITNPKAGL